MRALKTIGILALVTVLIVPALVLWGPVMLGYEIWEMLGEEPS